MFSFIELHCGDCVEVMRGIADGSVHCCVTSPPYFGLRDYGTARWEGGDPACDHVQGFGRRDSGRLSSDDRSGVNPAPVDTPIQFRDLCGKCGARRIDAQIGLERTPDEFVAKMVEVFREVRRVLRDDGTLWLNLGDSYAFKSGGGVQGACDEEKWGKGRIGAKRRDAMNQRANRSQIGPGLKTKDLIGIPWRVAFALQADGWYLRSDIIWAKPNPMPESVRDRPTKSHEYLFLLSKAEKYHFDADAVREPQTGDVRGRTMKLAPKDSIEGNDSKAGDGFHGRIRSHVEIPGGRHVRSVWTIATRPYKGAHFATFPPKLVEPCVKAGTSEKGCCPQCGKPWERVTSVEVDEGRERKRAMAKGLQGLPGRDTEGGQNGIHNLNGQSYRRSVTTLGWRPACSCFGHFEEIDDEPGNPWVKPRRVYVPDGPQPDPVPCTVLDPFAGSGTVGAVAKQLGRRFVGIDLNPAYLELARQRIGKVEVDQPLLAGVAS